MSLYPWCNLQHGEQMLRCRTITARVRIVREGADDDEGLRAFRSHLLEEPERRTDGQPGFPGVVAFLDELQTEVWKYMNEVGQQ